MHGHVQASRFYQMPDLQPRPLESITCHNVLLILCGFFADALLFLAVASVAVKSDSYLPLDHVAGFMSAYLFEALHTSLLSRHHSLKFFLFYSLFILCSF